MNCILYGDIMCNVLVFIDFLYIFIFYLYLIEIELIEFW